MALSGMVPFAEDTNQLSKGHVVLFQQMRVVITAMSAVAAVCCGVGPAFAQPATDFFRYSEAEPLSSFAPGDVIRARTLPFHLYGFASPLQATQLLYRSTDALGNPVANTTSFVRVPGSVSPKGVLSYQSAYDSLNPADSPSRAVAGNFGVLSLTPKGRNISIGNVSSNAENGALTAALALGYALNIPDTEGPDAHFGAGPEYGAMTLDSLRAITNAPQTGVTPRSRIGLLGYSGGAIASNWAAIRAPSYAPDIGKRLVGVAQGGVLVNPLRNLDYAEGSMAWAGVVGLGVVGLARAYDIDIRPYANSYGMRLVKQLSDASVLNAFYPGLTVKKIMKPQYPTLLSVPPVARLAARINMGTAPVPSTPMFIAQAANGILEGTLPGRPGIGRGDGVMIAGDVRALARRYCDAGLPIVYRQYDQLSHITGAVPWLAESIPWLINRFNAVPAPTNCATIPAGNPDALTDVEPVTG